ncbi:MAG: hypothetical protein KIT63_01550 [Rhodoferax sp.]|nr:hypothetical protein [Rhodoferax sp.]
MIIRTILCVCALRIDAVAIGKLFQETRALRGAAGIDGAIISDGERVAHLLVGMRDAVDSVVMQLRSDARMAEPMLLAMQDIETDHRPWPLAGWKAGWATPDVLDTMAAVAKSQSDGHLPDTLQALLGRCDLL